MFPFFTANTLGSWPPTRPWWSGRGQRARSQSAWIAHGLQLAEAGDPFVATVVGELDRARFRQGQVGWRIEAKPAQHRSRGYPKPRVPPGRRRGMQPALNPSGQRCRRCTYSKGQGGSMLQATRHDWQVLSTTAPVPWLRQVINPSVPPDGDDDQV